MTHMEHLGEADADGDEGGEKHEEVGDLRGGVAVEQAAQVDLVLEGDRVEDDALDDDLQLGLDQGLNVRHLLLQHLLLLHQIPRYQSQTNTKQPIKREDWKLGKNNIIIPSEMEVAPHR